VVRVRNPDAVPGTATQARSDTCFHRNQIFALGPGKPQPQWLLASMTRRLASLSITIATLIASASFFCFGFGYLLIPQMKAEFVRYRLAHYRVIVGWLQITGAAGLLVGLRYPSIGLAAGCGLALMMGVAVVTRLRIGDSLVQCVPAILFLLLNLYICVRMFERWSTG
jgi:hypothetical protein